MPLVNKGHVALYKAGRVLHPQEPPPWKGYPNAIESDPRLIYILRRIMMQSLYRSAQKDQYLVRCQMPNVPLT
jgi:hypothetical protein